jgi:GNAT superfamily N-acetyltransferase
MQVKIATDGDTDRLIPALMELRPHRTAGELRVMLPVLYREGYRIAYIGDDSLAYALAGFRTLNFLFSGKTLYLDDLVTHSGHKRKGYAGILLEWLKQYGKENGCDHFSLDSGFQRKEAYRLYLNSGLEVESLHFGRKLAEL